MHSYDNLIEDIQQHFDNEKKAKSSACDDMRNELSTTVDYLLSQQTNEDAKESIQKGHDEKTSLLQKICEEAIDKIDDEKNEEMKKIESKFQHLKEKENKIFQFIKNFPTIADIDYSDNIPKKSYEETIKEYHDRTIGQNGIIDLGLE